MLLRAKIVLCLCLFISACGFHLRGNIPLPEALQSMYVDANAGSFRRTLESMLTRLGAEIEAAEGAANVVLTIKSYETERTVGTLDDRGKANSYNLSLDVRYELKDAAGKSLRTATLSEVRRYDFDPTLIVETEAEEQELIADMEEALSLRIMRQLSRIVEDKPEDADEKQESNDGTSDEVSAE